MNKGAPVQQFIGSSDHNSGRSMIAFIDGVGNDSSLLRHQIFSSIKSELRPQTLRRDLERNDPASPDALLVSLFPSVPGAVLLMFDLADRNHFRQFSPDRKPYVAGFRKVIVPGNWLRRRILDDRSLQLREENVLPLGSPRIDYLRALAAAEPPKEPSDRLRVLFAPLHNNWSGRDGRPMSVASAFEPYLELLRSCADVTIVADGRNKDDKRPITRELLDADVVITDYTSLIYEAWSLNKPVIFPHWVCAARILEKAPDCAEAQIYRDRIGHHPENFDALIALLAQGGGLGLGDGVDAFMTDYLSNWKGDLASPAIARALEQLADPYREAREKAARAELGAALKEKNWDAAIALAFELLPSHAHDSSLFDQIARAYNGKGNWWQELSALETAVELRPNDAGLRYRLGVAAQRMGRHVQAAAAYAEAIRLAPDKATADWHYRLGYVYEARGVDGPSDLRRAAAAYDAACAKDETASRFGVGVLHAAAGRWSEASRAYQERLKEAPLAAELHYRAGMAHDRCYEWAEAETDYVNALALDPDNLNWHYRLGFVLERQEKYAEAAAAYLHAANKSKTHRPTWFYRAGYTLEKCGRLAEACNAYSRVEAKYLPPAESNPYLDRFKRERTRLIRPQLERQPNDSALWLEYSKIQEDVGDAREAAKAAEKAMLNSIQLEPAHLVRLAALEGKCRERELLESRLNRNCTNVEDWFRYSEVLEEAGDLGSAVEAMRQVVLRSNEHVSKHYHRLGALLMRSGQEQAACEAFRMQQIMQRPHGVYEKELEKSDALRETAIYREFFDVLSIEPRTILYESFGGEGCSDNPRGLFDAIQRDARFKNWRHFWVVGDMSKAPAELCGRRDVFFVVKNSLLYQRLLCTVEFLINNATFPYYYVRKTGQEYLNTWHGTPLKTLGYDIKETPIQRANTARNLIQASMFIAPNEHTERIMLDRYGVRKLFTGRSLLTGYPRIDTLVNAAPSEKVQIVKRLGLDPEKPIVLFAPTYRGHWAEPEIEAQLLADTLERIKSPEFNLVFRGHYFAERLIATMDLPVTIAPHVIDTCSLLSVVDVLITDYSSIFYDFLVTKRPIIHFVPDWDDYVEARGVYFGKEELPGIVCADEEELISALETCLLNPGAQISEQYLADVERFCALEDGKASQRVIEALFFDRQEPKISALPDGAKHLLIYGGELDEGVQFAALKCLLASIKDEGHVGTLVVDRHVVVNDVQRTSNAQSLLATSDVIIRYGRVCFSLEEAWLNEKMKMFGYQPSPALQALFESSLRHEVRRLFGHASPHVVIDFDARRPFWTNVISAIPCERRMIRLRGNIKQELSRQPSLERIVFNLKRFDFILSESTYLNHQNSVALDSFRVPAERFITLDPCISKEEIEKRIMKTADKSAAQNFIEAPGLRLLGAPGADHEAAMRMISLLARIVDDGRDATLGLLMPTGVAFTTSLRILESSLRNRVVFLEDNQDYLPLVSRSYCVLMSNDASGATQMAAEANFLRVPCLSMSIFDEVSDVNDLEFAISSAVEKIGAEQGGTAVMTLIGARQ